MARKISRASGFTLIELLMVIAIIGVLSSIVVVSVSSARQKSKISAAKQQLKQLQTAIAVMAIDTSLWPGNKTPDVPEPSVNNNEIWDLTPSSVGLVATNGSYPNWSGPYIRNIPLDPWGNPYFFDTDYQVTANGAPCNGGGGCSEVAVIGSFGPNGTGQNTYDSDDIIIILAR